MQDVQISNGIAATVNDDFVHIEDELNGSVSLNGREIQSLFSLWVKAGGLEAVESDDQRPNPQGSEA